MDLKGYWTVYLEKVDEMLTHEPFRKVFNFLEEKTKIGRKYLAAGFAVIIAWLGLGFFAPLVVNAVAFTYPAIQSIKSLESADYLQAKKWLTYWIVYG